MIVHGSNNFTTSGRKKKRIVSKKRKAPEFKEMKTNPLNNNFLQDEWSRKVSEHKAAKPFKLAPWTPDRNLEFKKEISKQYTISIPYNKGAYQVIPADDIDKIGK